VIRAHRLTAIVLALAGLIACGDAAKDESTSSTSTSSTSARVPAQREAEPKSSSDEDETSISVIKTKTKDGTEGSIGIKAPKGWTVQRAPTGPDPHGGKFTLAEATKGLDKTGTLAIHIDTSLGSIYCDLFEKEAPSAVANFVGLARAKRKFWDGDKLEWTARPYYDGTMFHRVMPGFMIQGGDHTGTGNGGIGYTIADEITPGERADKAGQMFMATRGAGTGESQFFITTRAAPHIDGKFTKLGECAPIKVIEAISRVASSGKPLFKPTTDVVVRGIEVRRLPGGRMKWMPKDTDLSIPTAVPAGRAVQVPASAQP
jgi:peptidyl-prolyl cis-trans isomerase A (cyclophilin A)